MLDRSGYRAHAAWTATRHEDQERLANIEELITAAKQFAAEDSSRTIGDFLENITLASDVDGWDEQQDCVSVMTLHAAKGLEFPVVYMLAVEQGLLPHERSLARDEEVGGGTPAGVRRHDAGQGGTVSLPRPQPRVPRANAVRGAEHVPRRIAGRGNSPPRPFRREQSHQPPSRTGAAAARQRNRAGTMPACGQGRRRFRRTLPETGDGRGFVEGMLVRHATYGMGRIVEVSGQGALRRVKIRFSTAGERTFIADKVTLEIVRKT